MDVYVATFCIFLSLVTQVIAAPIEDEITALPGLNKQPYWKQYSGFLNATGTKMLHYWFLESANNPQTDPLVLWMNGGPGCSSDLGLLSEHGPFVISSDGMTVTYNNYSWNKVANMLYLEAPAGVGFSYAFDKNYTTDDDLTSLDNYAALKNFFIKFPEFLSNDFYITGESYGGIYVPTLSSRVLDDQAINFKGFAVGNGLSDDELNDDSLLYFGYYHGLVGESLWNQMIQTCCAGNSTRCTFYRNSLNNTSCQQQLSKAFSLISYSGLNEYNLYAECQGQPSEGFFFNQKTQMFYHSLFGWKFTKEPQMQKKMKALKELMKVTKVGVTPPCLNYDNIIKYMNSSEVRRALHIPDSVQAWDVCSGDVHNTYQTLYHNVTDQYLRILNAKVTDICTIPV
ncbi:hypothetical protein CHS0354_013902 [Potamilus streckersoni]|uniref:Carboxypeptidase n=1 Tax=Potamilus streckersoni TaxID=2493646 RepID=A0AAE0VJW9_9BIVA|nr:hypothetical protein CHS0354_013902 [Potamilus streckersoni]